MLDWQTFRNTHLQLPWLFQLVVGDRDFDRVLKGHPPSFHDYVQRAFQRCLWFWPRVIDAAPWAAGAVGKAATPSNYMHIDADAQLLLNAVMEECPDRSASLLDLGCNCGRHITYLAKQGYRNLAGVDVMSEAISLFARTEPEIFRRANIQHDFFQRFLLRAADRQYDLTYSHGATIELVHPSFNVVEHIANVTKSKICLLLHEKHGYPRDWISQFSHHGFVLKRSQPIHTNNSGVRLVVLHRALQ
jgi:SAM-dependent methyltransferase